MRPLFPKWTNKIPLYLGLGAVVFLLSAIGGVYYYFSPKFLAVGYQPQQPILFSHKHHAGKLGLDCEYCHTTVGKATFAAVPPTSTCMGCHNNVAKDSPRLEMLRKNHEENKPIEWTQVHAIPRHAHFPHDAHINVAGGKAGVNCVTCHGRVDKMDTITQAEPLSMGWCLNCHNNPFPSLVPRDQVTNTLYSPIANVSDLAKERTTEESKKKFHENLGISENLDVNPPVGSCGGCHY